MIAEVRNAWAKHLSPLFAEFADDVVLENVDTSATEKDMVYDEPATTRIYTAPVTIKGRIKMGEDRLVTEGGQDIDFDARVTMRAEELEAKSAGLKLGTRITLEGTRYTTVHVESRGQVGNTHLLRRAYLKAEDQ